MERRDEKSKTTERTGKKRKETEKYKIRGKENESSSMYESFSSITSKKIKKQR